MKKMRAKHRRAAGWAMLTAGILPFLGTSVFAVFANNGISFWDNLVLCGFLYWWIYLLAAVLMAVGIYFVGKK